MVRPLPMIKTNSNQDSKSILYFIQNFNANVQLQHQVSRQNFPAKVLTLLINKSVMVDGYNITYLRFKCLYSIQ